jgi:hypothetical protein
MIQPGVWVRRETRGRTHLVKEVGRSAWTHCSQKLVREGRGGPWEIVANPPMDQICSRCVKHFGEAIAR